MADMPTEAGTPAETAPASNPTEGTAPKPIDPKDVEKVFKSKVEAAKRNRKTMSSEWKGNIERRIGHVSTLYTGGVTTDNDTQSEINPDWSLTKTKTANLYSQVPTVQLTHDNDQYAAAIPPFAKALNYEIGQKRGNVGVAMEECLNDTVNAAGIGAILVGYAARFVEKTVPAIDTKMFPPEILVQFAPTPLPPGVEPSKEILSTMLQQRQMPMTAVQQVVSDKFFMDRVSPIDLLWPVEFTGSCFDNGDWIGHTGRMSWAEAKNEFKLTDDQKDDALGGAGTQTDEDLRSNPEKAGIIDAALVKYDELFYWRYRVDPEEKSFHAIWRIVYVHGINDPVLHEPWKGQRLDEQTHKYVGACKFPIQVLTLTYITDNPVPPSDSSAGRPQVKDLRRSRSQMFQNRERSTPLRWFDVNRVDQSTQDLLMRGTVQGMIPTNGDGGRSIGEIARASYPAEDFSFDQMTKNDLMESWQVGPNQLGTSGSGKKTSAEVSITQQNFSTRIGQERGRVAAFFLSVCEVVAGLMVLYSDFPILSDQEREAMQQAWDSKHILHDLVLTIRPDSTVVLDSNARIDKLFKFLNMTVKSGFINPEPIIAEIAELSGIDPSKVMVKPAPHVEESNVSLRLSGKDDLINPVALAILVKSGQAPSPEHLEAAKKILMAAQQPPQPEQPQPPPGGGGPPGPPGPGGPPQGQPPGPDKHPQWNTASKVAKRSRDIGGGG